MPRPINTRARVISVRLRKRKNKESNVQHQRHQDDISEAEEYCPPIERVRESLHDASDENNNIFWCCSCFLWAALCDIIADAIKIK